VSPCRCPAPRPAPQRGQLFGDLFHAHSFPARADSRRAARGSQKGASEAESRARGNNAGPLRQAPSARLRCGLSGTERRRRRRAPLPIFTPAGRRGSDTRGLLCLSTLEAWPVFVHAWLVRAGAVLQQRGRAAAWVVMAVFCRWSRRVRGCRQDRDEPLAGTLSSRRAGPRPAGRKLGWRRAGRSFSGRPWSGVSADYRARAAARIGVV